MQVTESPGIVVLDHSFRVIFASGSILERFPSRSAAVCMDDLTARIRENLLPLLESSSSGDRRETISRIFPELAESHTFRGILLEPRTPGPNALALLFEPRTLASTEFAAALESYSLTRREFEILHYLVLGLTNKEIAQRMEISPNTVKAFLRSVSTKMNAPTRSAIVGLLLGDNRRPSPNSLTHPPAKRSRPGPEPVRKATVRTIDRSA